ncbi:hypothetical protein KUL72_24880 [Bradyrhizobium arachidis]|uniref:hypothetical protein n=1 Tax=Bradyrhizobium arachidis TaxID=858423 RepID=UPI0021FCFC58|nr:hypothetical protein [Bradyrhizobium arachidis]UVO34687.1 hypothetical protein KUL72_24880 [Bradyrhizobium arachidis]
MGEHDASAKLLTVTAAPEKRHIDSLNEDATVLHGLNPAGYLDQLSGGGFRGGEGARSGVLHRVSIRESR